MGEVKNAGNAVCEEFRHDFPAYLVKVLIPSRGVLLEDHLSRCPSCRKRMAEMRGKRTVTDMRVRSSSRWVRLGTLAAAASLLIAIVYVGRDTIDVMMAPGGPRATVVSTEGGLFRVAAGSVQASAAIGERDSVRTGPGARAVLQLADGSRVDVNERTELFLTAAWSGQTIHLQRGDIIVNAATQRRGSLRVLTRDSIASVKGTIFAVSAGVGGSVVSVVEGIGGGEPAGERTGSQTRRSGRVDPGAGEFGGASRLLESRFAELSQAACVIREDRTRAREFSRGTAE